MPFLGPFPSWAVFFHHPDPKSLSDRNSVPLARSWIGTLTQPSPEFLSSQKFGPCKIVLHSPRTSVGTFYTIGVPLPSHRSGPLSGASSRFAPVPIPRKTDMMLSMMPSTAPSPSLTSPMPVRNQSPESQSKR